MTKFKATYDSPQGEGALSGSKASPQAPAGLGPSGYDPARLAAELLPRLGKAQRRVILSLSDDWGPSACHQTAKRMFYGVGGQHRPVVLHRHRHDNVWALSDLGMALKAAIATEAGTAATVKQGAVHEGAGLKGIAQGDAQ